MIDRDVPIVFFMGRPLRPSVSLLKYCVMLRPDESTYARSSGLFYGRLGMRFFKILPETLEAFRVARPEAVGL